MKKQDDTSTPAAMPTFQGKPPAADRRYDQVENVRLDRGAPDGSMPAYAPKRYHGQGQIGSVPRTQYYLASSGDYTPEALRKIYNTPTSTKWLGYDVGGDYTRSQNAIRLNDKLRPINSNIVLRHEAAHMFDRNQYLDRGWPNNDPNGYESDMNGFYETFAANGNYMPYPPGRADVVEARAAVAMEPGRYKGLENLYPEFTPEAWKKKIPPIFPNDMGLKDYNAIENLRAVNGNRLNAMPAYAGTRKAGG